MYPLHLEHRTGPPSPKSTTCILDRLKTTDRKGTRKMKGYEKHQVVKVNEQS